MGRPHDQLSGLRVHEAEPAGHPAHDGDGALDDQVEPTLLIHLGDDQGGCLRNLFGAAPLPAF